MAATTWLGLLIGNTQLHWGYFEGDALVAQWHQPHMSLHQPPTSQPDTPQPDAIATLPPPYRALAHQQQLWIASVVPAQTAYWRPYSQEPITLEQIPIQGAYPTFGIDRALALWGAGQRWGFPVLVVDGGTALTYTGADSGQTLVGGAILPGLGLQLRSLHQGTAQLPAVALSGQVARWALTTEEAIWSGVFHSAIAGAESFIGHWRQRFPGSPVVFTGGDGERLYQNLSPKMRAGCYYEANLGLWGLQHVRVSLVAR